ncbi:MAG: ABC transporter permease [Actinomycetota bacterium]
MDLSDGARTLWQRRDLVLALATSEFKGRYRRLGLGVLWAVLNPLVQGLLIAVVLHHLARFSLGFPYALFVLAGIMPWNFFVSALTSGTTSILDSADIVQRVAVPRAAVPTASLLTNLFNFGFVLATLVAICAAFAPGRMSQVWLLPVCVALQVGLTYGLVLLISPLHVRYRDLGQLVSAATLAWFWATPVIYPISILHGVPALEALVRANPMTGVTSLYRTAVLHLPVDRWALAASIAWTAATLVAGWIVFARREATVADFI